MECILNAIKDTRKERMWVILCATITVWQLYRLKVNFKSVG